MLRPGRGFGHAAAQQAHIGARAAHVERNRVVETAGRHDRSRGARPARRPRQQQCRRDFGAHGNGYESAGARHHEHTWRDVVDVEEIPAQRRTQVGVGDGGDRALVLAHLGRDLVRAAHVEPEPR